MSKSKEALLVLLHDRPVAYHPALVKVAGSVTAALFLSQLLYWHGKGSDPEWIYKTQADMEEETGLSRREEVFQPRCITAWISTF